MARPMQLRVQAQKHRMRLMFRLALFAVAMVGLTLYAAYSTFVVDEEVEGALHLPSRRLQEQTPLEAELSSKDVFTPDQLKGGAVLLYIAGVAYMFIALAIACDEWFVPCLEVIVEKLGISNDIAGATFMAAGGSAPELFTSFIGTFTGSSVGFGTIVGSAVFNVLFVIGMCVLFSKDILVLTWWPLFRDCMYYACALGVLAISFGVTSPGEITAIEAFILFAMYFGYVLVMFYNQKIYLKLMSVFGKGGGSEFAESKKRMSVELEKSSDELKDGRDLEGAEEGVEEKKDDTVNSLRVSGPSSRRGSLFGGTQATFRRPSTFRAGFLKLLISDKPILETAGIHVVHKIAGDVWETFQNIDKDGSGSIDKSELKALLTELGSGEPTDEEVENALTHLDLDNDGSISFYEFKDWYCVSEKRMAQEMRAVFVEFDKDGDGCIATNELKALLIKLDPPEIDDVNDEYVAEVLGHLDDNGDGMIDQEEFSAWYLKSELFLQKKRDMQEQVDAAQGIDISWPTGPNGEKAEWRAVIMYVVTAPLVFPMYYLLPDVRTPKGRNLAWLGFVGTIIFIGIFSYLMVWWATIVGFVFGIPIEVLGLTFLAAGTSIPDLLSSVIVAKQGEGDMAVSSSIGSNIFDVLVCLPFPWLIWTLANGKGIVVGAEGVTKNVVILLVMILLVIATIASVGWRLDKKLAGVFFTFYVIFVLQDLFSNEQLNWLGLYD